MTHKYDDQDDRSYPTDGDVDIQEIYDNGETDFGIYNDYDSDDSDSSDDE